MTENTQTLTALVAQRTEDQLKQGVDEMEKTIKDIEDFLNDPKRFDSLGSQISDGVESALDGVLLMTEGNVQLKLALQQIEQGEEQLAQTRKQVLEQLDLDGMLSVSMVEQLLTAQDFSMPAGYIDDNAGVSYMVSVGNEIRTSGELRISNFLLWQSAYSEYYFTSTLWPDFGRKELCRALWDYSTRKRRFGRA